MLLFFFARPVKQEARCETVGLLLLLFRSLALCVFLEQDVDSINKPMVHGALSPVTKIYFVDFSFNSFPLFLSESWELACLLSLQVL